MNNVNDHLLFNKCCKCEKTRYPIVIDMEVFSGATLIWNIKFDT